MINCMSGSSAFSNSTQSYLKAPFAKIVAGVDNLGFVRFGFEQALGHLGWTMGVSKKASLDYMLNRTLFLWLNNYISDPRPKSVG